MAAMASETPLKIVFVSAEVAPWSKTGGLGDVVGGLPIALADRGHQVLTVAPRYDQYYDAWDTSVSSTFDGVEGEVRYFHTLDKGVDRVWVDHPLFLAKVEGKTGSKLYGLKSGADYVDNLKRFRLFNLAALEALRALPFSPGEDALMVCNDWHTALVPVLLKDVYQPRGEFTKTKSALVIHNVAFQGRFWADRWEELGLPQSSQARFQFSDGINKVFDETEDPDEESLSAPGVKYNKLNWLQAGMLTADKLLTVSPTYAKEMSSGPQLGVELDGVIRSVGGIEGIVNGMDTSEWCPTQDKFLDVKYDEETVAEGKAIAKETLQGLLGLEVNPKAPLFGFIGRLEEQKGVDVLLEALPQALQGSSAAQVAVLGTGKADLEAKVEAVNSLFPGRAAGVVEFNGPLAHLMTAGCDFMLVPSRFEPCGLIQMHAMQYGTVPVVASTGGLVDTVKDGVTGFHAGKIDPDRLDPADADALAKTITRAAGVYGSASFEDMRAKCIGQDLSWEVPAQKWEAVLQEMRAGKPNRAPEASSFSPTPVKNIDAPADPKKSDILAGRAAPVGAAKPTSIGQTVQQATGSATPSSAPSRGSTLAAGKSPSSPAPASATSASTAAAPASAAAAAVPADGATRASESGRKPAAGPTPPAVKKTSPAATPAAAAGVSKGAAPTGAVAKQDETAKPTNTKAAAAVKAASESAKPAAAAAKAGAKAQGAPKKAAGAASPAGEKGAASPSTAASPAAKSTDAKAN